MNAKNTHKQTSEDLKDQKPQLKYKKLTKPQPKFYFWEESWNNVEE